MSAAQKKTKQNSDGLDFGKNMNRKSKKSDSSKRMGRITAITVAVVALLFVFSLLINSDYFRQNFAALKIDNVKYSITDFNYYYQNVYIQYSNAMSGSGDLGSSMLPSKDAPLKSQIYNEETGETWSDFFEKMALDQMRADNKILLEAQKAGYQLPEDEKADMEKEIENLKGMGYASGFPNFGDYLAQAYGKSMTEEVYRENVERSYLLSSYVTYVRDSYQYTPEEIETYYNENKNLFDTFTFRYFLVTAAELNEADYPDTAAYDAAKAEAVKAAGVKAQEYVSKITDEQSFIDAAREYDPETYKEDSASERTYKGELLGSVYGDWLRDEGRQFGDVSSFEMTNGYYVVMYKERDNNHYPTVNVQQVLVQQKAVNQNEIPADDDGTAYDEAVATAKKTAEDTANKIYDEWIAGGATQEKLSELMILYTADISAESSKLNENVYKNQLVPVLSSWLYDTARKPGDHTLIYVEGTGYYILNYVGTGKQYSDMLSDTKKRDEQLQAWKDSLTGSEPKMTWLMALTK